MPPRKLLFAVIALLYGILSYLCPPMFDDFLYMGDSLGVPVGFEKMALGWDELKSHFLIDVGRLSNVLATVFLCLFPRWVFGVAQTVVTYVALEYGCRLARLPERSLWCAVWVGMWVWLLPWIHLSLILDYCFNYLWPSVFIIFVLYEMFSAPRCRVRWWTLLVALVAGWLHEQFSVAVCCGFLVVLLFCRRAVTRPRLALALAFVAGTALNFVFPGIWHRASDMESFGYTFGALDLAFSCMAYAAPVALLLSWRRLDENRRALALILVTAVAVSLAICLVTPGYSRALWAPQLFGGLCVLVCLSALGWSLPKWLKVPSGWGVYAVTIASLVLSIAPMAACRREFREYEKAVLLTGSDCIYHDRSEPSVATDVITGFRVYSRLFYGKHSRILFGAYYLDWKELRPLPTALRGRRVGDVPETAPGSGLRYVGGCLVAAPELQAPYAGELFTIPELIFEDGSSCRREVDMVPFTDAEGHDWVYIDTSRRFRSDPGRIVGMR